MGISYRIGQVVGLPLGGWLAHPERHIGLTGPFWQEYPFALPYFVGAGFAFLAAAYSYLTLRETLKNPWMPFRIQATAFRYHDIESSSPHNEPTAQGQVTYWSVLTKTTFNFLMGSLFVCLMGDMLSPIISLWAFTPLAAGGLEMDEASIGMLLSVRAAMQIIGLSFLPIFERRLGPGRLYRPMSIAWLLTFPLFPLASFFARLSSKSNHPLVWANILVIYTMRTLTAVCWPCLSIMLNTAATSPEALTRLNALSQFTIVIPQALGPAIGSSLFAFSVQTSFLHGNLIWVALTVLGFMFTVHAWMFIYEREILEPIGQVTEATRDNSNEH